MGLTIKKIRRRGSEVNELARVVIQLERFPFSLLDFNAVIRGDELRPQLEIHFEVGGTLCTWQATGIGSDGKPAVSLPGPYGNDVMVALGRAWNAMAFDAWNPDEEAHRTIRLPYRRLIELMGRTPGSTAYGALDETLERLSSLVIRAKGAWRENGGWVDGWKAITAFEAINYKRRRGAADRGTITFVFTPTFARALTSDSRLLDTRPYNALKLSTSRRLYRLLEAERYQVHHRGAGELRLSLAQVRERMPLAETRPNKVRRTLDRAHEELTATGYLTAMPLYAEECILGRRYPAIYVTYTFAQVRAVEASESGESNERGTSTLTAEQLARLKEVAGIPDCSGPQSDLVYWVQEIERITGDRRSSGFYKQVVEAFANHLDQLEFVLRGVQRDGEGQGLKALGAAFTARIKARAEALGIALPREAGCPQPGSGTSLIGDILAAPRRPASRPLNG